MARNGYLAEDGIRLVTVEDNDQLIATAAASFFRMRAAAAADGVTISIVEPAGAYRTAWVQNDMVDRPWLYNLNPNSTVKFSRYGQSHGWGNRFDANSAAVPWLLRRGAEFGWIREYGARDPNHFKHDGVTAISGAGASSGAQADAALLRRQKEDGMYVGGSGTTVYWSWTDANGHPRLRTCGQAEAAIARKNNLANSATAAEITALGVEAGWPSGGPEPVLPLPKVDAELNVGDIQVNLPDDIARKVDIPTATENGQAARDAIVKPA
jgi:hypothetical protein